MIFKKLFLFSLVFFALRLSAPAQAPPVEGDYILRDFKFESGESLPELKLHYRTLGTPRKDSTGQVRNAVLIMHGTGGTGAQFLSRQFAGVLFGPGQLLDSAKYYIILPDGIGHGGSSKPSDGLRMKFPRYNYNDMLYYFDASRDYDPSPMLERIRAPLIAINSADDQVNPPELGIAEREIKRVARGRFILLPITDQTRGHGTHSIPAIWKQYLAELLKESDRP